MKFEKKNLYSLVKTKGSKIKVIRKSKMTESEMIEKNLELASKGRTYHWEKLAK